jgi:class 3 adenylate cyclase
VTLSPIEDSGRTPLGIGQTVSLVADIPETRFAKLGRDRIAYQVVGEGPPDLLWVTMVGEALDSRWEYPPLASFLRRLASFSRLIMFDRRGLGGSDPVRAEALPGWEDWVEDALAVLDAVESTTAAILGVNEAGPTAMLFAATQPERTQALILFNPAARSMKAADYPWGWEREAELENIIAFIEEHWGTELMAQVGNPGLAEDKTFRQWLAKGQRMMCSGREAAAYVRQTSATDVRNILPSIRVPTLVLHRKDVPFFTLAQGQHVANHIPEARFVSVPGSDVTMYTKPSAKILDQIEEFLTGAPPLVETDRALATILFTDIVSSTERAASLGDRRWRELLESHDVVARTIIQDHGGRLVKLTGDGILATFDGPGRAIRGAFALRDALDLLRIGIRVGLHTGEVELRGDDIGGIGVHVAARVLEHAQPEELLVSAAVPLLVAGSGLEFEDRGEHELKGVPGIWKLFAVIG